jgi:hypothetical protein
MRRFQSSMMAPDQMPNSPDRNPELIKGDRSLSRQRCAASSVTELSIEVPDGCIITKFQEDQIGGCGATLVSIIFPAKLISSGE